MLSTCWSVPDIDTGMDLDRLIEASRWLVRNNGKKTARNGGAIAKPFLWQLDIKGEEFLWVIVWELT